MNMFSISMLYLKRGKTRILSSIISLAIGFAIIVMLLLFSTQVQERLARSMGGVDLVIGSKSSPTQLILSTLFHVDLPPANFDLDNANKILKEKATGLVYSAVPVALGDNYQGFRIVGSDIYFLLNFGNYQVEKARFPDKIGEAMLGFNVARKTGLKNGDNFVGSHGISEGGETHADHPYRVVGIMEKTNSVTDNLILTNLETIYDIHNEHDHNEHSHSAKKNREVTAIFLKYSTPLAATILPEFINTKTNLVAASPAYEINRILKAFSFAVDAGKAIAFIIILFSGLGIFLVLSSSLSERSFDLALMRSLGANRRKIAGIIISEGVMISLLGVIAGILLGHLTTSLIGLWLEQTKQFSVTGFRFHINEIYFGLITILLGFLASLVPALRAYNIDIAKILARAI